MTDRAQFKLAAMEAAIMALAYEAYKEGQMHPLSQGGKHAIGYGFDAWWDHLTEDDDDEPDPSCTCIDCTCL